MSFGPAFQPPVPPESGAIDPESKYASYDPSGLAAAANPQAGAIQAPGALEAAPSPQGAASQGALGDPASAGESPAFGEGEARKPISDFHAKFIDGDNEDKDLIAEKMERQFGDQGLSLQGAVDKIFEQGGEDAMAAAEQFGYVPTEKQASSNEAFKSREEALADYGVKVDKKKEADLVEEKRLENRRAMGGFLMDVGLRILASNREDVGGAIGEGVLGAQQARADKKRLADEDRIKAEDRDIAKADRTRKQEREDKSDSRAIAKEDRDAEQSAYDKSQRGEQEKKVKAGRMSKIVTEDGTVLYVDPSDPSSAEYVYDSEGNKIIAKDVGLSAAQIATNTRAYNAKVNSKVEKMKAQTEYDLERNYPALEGLSGEARIAAIIKIAQEEVGSQGNTPADNDPLGLL